MSQDSPHRKFLKLPSHKFPIGSVFPEFIQLAQEEQVTDFRWLRNVEKGSIIFFTADFCSACDPQPIKNFCEKFDEFNLVLFVIKYPDENQDLSSYGWFTDLGGKLYVTTTDLMISQLGISTVPSVIATNRIGQVLSGDIVNTMEKIKDVSNSLIKVYCPEKLHI